MTDLRIKQALSAHLHSFGKPYADWAPEFQRLKQLAEIEGQTITDYYHAHFMKEHPKKQPKKQKVVKPTVTLPEPKQEAFVPPDPIKEIIEEIPKTREELIAEKEAQLRALQPIEEEEEEFPCPHCEKVYTSEPSLKRHITMKHKEAEQ